MLLVASIGRRTFVQVWFGLLPDKNIVLFFFPVWLSLLVEEPKTQLI